MNYDTILNFYQNLRKPTKILPDNIQWINSLENHETKVAQQQFYKKFYADSLKRIFLFGINPGRFGAGITGIPFTDPLFLDSVCGIENSFDKKHELSSRFIYEVIESFGGAKNFYNKVYLTAVCPLGFTKNGVNINYYDNTKLQTQIWSFMKAQIQKQLSFASRDIAFSLGSGKNFQVLKQMNMEEKWFDKIIALPHPRWVMQYKLKHKETFINQYKNQILAA